MTGDVTQDTPTVIVAKIVNQDILEWVAKKFVAVIALTMTHVTMSVECVLTVVRTGIMDQTVRTLVTTDIMAETVQECVHLIAKHAMSQMESVHVRLVGWVLPVPLSATSPLEKTASIHVVHCVSSRHVTDSTGVVYMNVKTTHNVMILQLLLYHTHLRGVYQLLLEEQLVHA